MSISNIISNQINADRNIVRNLWDKLEGIPGGKSIFSKLIGRAAPYTGSINAKVHELRPGYSRITLADKPSLRNHLECVHAVALVNLAEVTGNLALSYSLPDNARFIVAGISIEYLKKSRGTITGTCESPLITSSERMEYQVPVVMQDASGGIVATASLRTLIGPKL
jgi:acyl-coenzyme A thioesterase PaaI-like protein